MDRRLVRALVCLMPMCRIKLLLLRRAGYTIAKDARIDPCVVWSVDHLNLGARSRIDFGTVVRDLTLLDLGDDAAVGSWNWVSGSTAFPAEVSPRRLVLGRGSCLTTRHYLDATGGITLGDFSTVAGRRCTLLTHGVDFMRSVQTADPIAIGDHCLVNANCTVLAGTVIEDRVIVVAGSLVAGTFKSGGVYVSGQARRVRDVEAGYFSRSVGFISTAAPDASDVAPDDA